MNKLLSQKKISAEFEKQDLHEDDLQRDKKNGRTHKSAFLKRILFCKILFDNNL
jgi:hypothetical protein